MNDLFSEMVEERAAIREFDGGETRQQAESNAVIEVQCIRCDYFKLRDADPKMAKQGFGNCKHKPAWQYYSPGFSRSCNIFKPAAPDIVAKRIEWNDRRNAK